MKLHITPEQLGELSEKGKEGYQDFFGCKGDLCRWCEGKGTCGSSPLAAIGQMLEFLKDGGEILLKEEDKDKELCDILWEAVKGELEK